MSSAIKEKRIQINKRLKGLTRDQLQELSKDDLVEKVVQLQAYNYQLKNILQKKLNDDEKQDDEFVQLLQDIQTDCLKKEVPKETAEGAEEKATEPVTEGKKKRKFDFSKCHKRHVLLRFLYFGWDYQGFACQEDSNATIEFHLFNALTRACLIESRNTSNYHRCGRTDKEVSAFCQTISIDLRSKFPEAEQFDEDSIKKEIDYCGLLNRILPRNIQCIAWMPVRCPTYSARFDCVARTYRYFFPQGDLDIARMRVACKLLQRHTDFRNFCKMDVHNGVTNYTRNLQEASVHLCPNESPEDSTGYAMYYLEIKANAFLWHQIRCIMAVLLLVGQGKEEPEVVTDLLDVATNPCKPQYTPAIGLPLNLFNCEFRERSLEVAESDKDASEDSTEPHTTSWVFEQESMERLIENVQSEWTQFSIKSTMIRNVLHHLEDTYHKAFSTASIVKGHVYTLQDCVKPRQYQKLLSRKRCESLENRIEHYVKKQRLVVKNE